MADYLVDVFVEAIPYSDTFYRLSDADKAQVSAQFVGELNTLVQLPAAQWHDQDFPNSNYDDIRREISKRLPIAVTPPGGRVLVLPSEEAVYWKPTTLGHSIGFMALLSDPAGGNVGPWDLTPVTFNNMVHLARVGFSYLCKPA